MKRFLAALPLALALGACSGAVLSGGEGKQSGTSREGGGPAGQNPTTATDDSVAEPQQVTGTFLVQCGEAIPVPGAPALVSGQAPYGCAVLDPATKALASGVTVSTVTVTTASGPATPALAPGPSGTGWSVLFSFAPSAWATVKSVEVKGTGATGAFDVTDATPSTYETCATNGFYNRSPRACETAVSIAEYADPTGTDWIYTYKGDQLAAYVQTAAAVFMVLPALSCGTKGLDCPVPDDPRVVTVAHLTSDHDGHSYYCVWHGPNCVLAQSIGAGPDSPFSSQGAAFRAFAAAAYPGAVPVFELRNSAWDELLSLTASPQNLPTGFEDVDGPFEALPPPP